MKRKINNIPKKFEVVKNLLSQKFPFDNFKVGGYMGGDTLYDIGYVKSPNFKAVSATVEVVGDSMNLRIYRSGDGTPTYKIDEYLGVDKKVYEILPKDKFDHYIYSNIPDNIMGRTNLSFKLISDKKGNLIPDRRPDGTVEAFINIESPDIEKRFLAQRPTDIGD